MIVSPWYPVPPVGYGGIELMAYNLARELQLRGHQVCVVGQQGSKGPFEVAAVAPESWSEQLGTRDQVSRESLFLYRAYQLVRRRAFDVVHDHSGFTGILLAATSGLQTPVVATLHGDLTEAEGDFLAAVDRRVHLVAISRSQQAQVASVSWRRVVYNAVDPSEYNPVSRHDEKDDYLIQLARITPSKGQHLAIELARRLGLRLVLAGKVDNDATAYFESEIKPHLGDKVTWHENVVGAEKARLLSRAKAMVFPIQWEEPFGIAMVESMVSGTPVLAMARGAASELVEPGITGWLADDLDGLVAAFARIGEIDLERCVKRAAERFGPGQMADGYQSVYERAIQESYHR
ncbi:MAG TPA: glycosyltransferase family 4 protein [Candidatus Limnocylindria bacterium]|jgi:glycosyltransferase involved in cell wall biosynthesis|nr:glycosyltransferase family 4 protein [Candidatus Limnocylindria bacterium]